MFSVRRRFILVYATLAAVAEGYSFAKHLEYVKTHTIPAGLRPFDVNGPIPTCGRWKDTMPKTRDQAAYQLYINARKLWRSKIAWQLTRQQFTSIFHDVQAAANQGDWGARALLAHFYRSGLGPLDSNHVLDIDLDKSVEIVRMAVAAGQAWGYYDLGVAHEQGYGNATQDEQIAWAYYLKAAELGSPDAQMALASAYVKVRRWEAEEAMIMCAYKQGHGPAAYDLGGTAKYNRDFRKALTYYQAGVRFGSKFSAVVLRQMFDTKEWNLLEKQDRDAFKELGILPDPERKNRYDQISDALELNPDLKLTRLDQVVPLPPAELPAWNSIQDAVEPERDGVPTY
ncbi:DUF6396 domain-containing protein [Massilia sp.]|uniref:SEL1-like repeat protein n=1 Tax=Massilia sp. TaxID=1882437 RepID=UPI00289AB746|nr:DUF6396 domain-containing protein [Massilia sp.]